MRIGWWILLIILFGLTLRMGVWYGGANTPLELRAQVERVETENIKLRDEVAALEVEAVTQKGEIKAIMSNMDFFDYCRKRDWRGC